MSEVEKEKDTFGYFTTVGELVDLLSKVNRDRKVELQIEHEDSLWKRWTMYGSKDSHLYVDNDGLLVIRTDGVED